MVDALALNLLLGLPLVGLTLLVLLPASRVGLLRAVSLGVTTAQFVLGTFLFLRFDGTAPGLQFATDYVWIPALGVHYRVGLDGYNVLLVLLTVFLGPLVVLGSFTAVNAKLKLFHAMLQLLQCAMLGTLLAQDLFLFYVFWELMLIPMFLLIGIWGGERRIYATLKFVLYTAFGSVLMLAALIYLIHAGYQNMGRVTFDLQELYPLPLSLGEQALLLGAFGLAFAIKVPMVPFHTWLPDAHVEAPTTGSVILAGVMLKMGTYGFMKLGFPLFPDAARVVAPGIMVLSVISILYGAGLALVQKDIKKIIAYSSISHLGYVMLGLASADLMSVQGALLQMVSHGLTAGGLFLMVGMIYERCHTRELAAYGGLAKLLPAYSVFFMILTLAAIGLPTTSGFAGEFMILMGVFTEAYRGFLETGVALPLWVASAAVLGVVLGALYMLWFAERFLFGAARAPHQPLLDLGRREKLILMALVAAIFWIGLYPQSLLGKTEHAAQDYQTRFQAVKLSPGSEP